MVFDAFGGRNREPSRDFVAAAFGYEIGDFESGAGVIWIGAAVGFGAVVDAVAVVVGRGIVGVMWVKAQAFFQVVGDVVVVVVGVEEVVDAIAVVVVAKVELTGREVVSRSEIRLERDRFGAECVGAGCRWWDDDPEVVDADIALADRSVGGESQPVVGEDT